MLKRVKRYNNKTGQGTVSDPQEAMILLQYAMSSGQCRKKYQTFYQVNHLLTKRKWAEAATLYNEYLGYDKFQAEDMANHDAIADYTAIKTDAKLYELYLKYNKNQKLDDIAEALKNNTFKENFNQQINAIPNIPDQWDWEKHQGAFHAKRKSLFMRALKKDLLKNDQKFYKELAKTIETYSEENDKSAKIIGHMRYHNLNLDDFLESEQFVTFVNKSDSKRLQIILQKFIASKAADPPGKQTDFYRDMLRSALNLSPGSTQLNFQKIVNLTEKIDDLWIGHHGSSTLPFTEGMAFLNYSINASAYNPKLKRTEPGYNDGIKEGFEGIRDQLETCVQYHALMKELEAEEAFLAKLLKSRDFKKSYRNQSSYSYSKDCKLLSAYKEKITSYKKTLEAQHKEFMLDSNNEETLDTFRQSLNRIGTNYPKFRHDQLRKCKPLSSKDKDKLFVMKNSILNEKMGKLRSDITTDMVYLADDYKIIKNNTQYIALNKSWRKCHGYVPAEKNKDFIIKLAKRVGDAEDRYMFIGTTPYTSHQREVGKRFPMVRLYIPGVIDILRTSSLAAHNKNESIDAWLSRWDILHYKIPAIVNRLQEIDPYFEPEQPGHHIIDFDYMSYGSFSVRTGFMANADFMAKVDFMANAEENKNNQNKSIKEDILATHQFNQPHKKMVRTKFIIGVNGFGKEKSLNDDTANEIRLLNQGTAMLLLKNVFENSASLKKFSAGFSEAWNAYHNDYKDFLKHTNFTHNPEQYFYNHQKAKNRPTDYRDKLATTELTINKALEENLTYEDILGLILYNSIQSGDYINPENAMITQAIATMLGASVTTGNIKATGHCKSSIDRFIQVLTRLIQLDAAEVAVAMTRYLSGTMSLQQLKECVDMAATKYGVSIPAHQIAANEVTAPSKATLKNRFNPMPDTNAFETIKGLESNKAGDHQSHKYKYEKVEKFFRRLFGMNKYQQHQKFKDNNGKKPTFWQKFGINKFRFKDTDKTKSKKKASNEKKLNQIELTKLEKISDSDRLDSHQKKLHQEKRPEQITLQNMGRDFHDIATLVDTHENLPNQHAVKTMRQRPPPEPITDNKAYVKTDNREDNVTKQNELKSDHTPKSTKLNIDTDNNQPKQQKINVANKIQNMVNEAITSSNKHNEKREISGLNEHPEETYTKRDDFGGVKMSDFVYSFYHSAKIIAQASEQRKSLTQIADIIKKQDNEPNKAPATEYERKWDNDDPYIEPMTENAKEGDKNELPSLIEKQINAFRK